MNDSDAVAKSKAINMSAAAVLAAYLFGVMMHETNTGYPVPDVATFALMLATLLVFKIPSK